MKYFEAEFVISPLSSDATDLLAAIAGEAGFESFEETPTGLKGYVQQQLFDHSALQTALADSPFDNVNITYTIREAEDRDWNEQWEQEGFEPIVVSRSEECGVRSENTPAADSPSLSNHNSPLGLPLATNGTQEFSILNSQFSYPYTYLYNISNRLSQQFYGAKDLSAYELKGGDGPIMQCRHCIRYALGYCVKHGGQRPTWHEPLSLVLGDGRRFRLEFDCKHCQMNVFSMHN